MIRLGGSLSGAVAQGQHYVDYVLMRRTFDFIPYFLPPLELQKARVCRIWLDIVLPNLNSA